MTLFRGRTAVASVELSLPPAHCSPGSWPERRRAHVRAVRTACAACLLEGVARGGQLKHGIRVDIVDQGGHFVGDVAG